MNQPLLILGSQSPRRKRVLDSFSLPFKQVVSNFDESTVRFTGDPARYVLEQSLNKAKLLVETHKELPILTADTTVYFNGKIYEKPEDEQAVFNTLSTLSGQWHQVFTGVALAYKGDFQQGVEETHVLFNILSEENIRSYIKNAHWKDKAGGYAIQAAAGSLLIKRIEGALDNVVGLPIGIVSQLLKTIGIDLWDYIQDG